MVSRTSIQHSLLMTEVCTTSNDRMTHSLVVLWMQWAENVVAWFLKGTVSLTIESNLSVISHIKTPLKLIVKYYSEE